MSYRDDLEKREILERDSPYWFDICSFCSAYEGEAHWPDCDWVRIRLQHNLEVRAA